MYGGQIPTTGSSTDSCSNWWAIGGNEMTSCSNSLMHMVGGMPDFRTADVTFVAKLFAFGRPDMSLPAFESVSSELLEAISAFGPSVRLAALNKEASNWAAFQPKFITELAAFFAERSEACYATDNNERALFDRFKMINAEFKYAQAPVTMTTPWEAVAGTSVSTGDWMTNLLYAGSVSQMMMNYADERVAAAQTEISARRWFIKTVKENGVDVKYIYFGPVNKPDTQKMKLVDYLNTGIWTTYEVPKDAFLNKALAAYRVAYSRSDGRLPDINNPAVAACINALDVTTMATWSASTLVAWQLLQLRGAFGDRVAAQFTGTRGGGTHPHHEDHGHNDGTPTPIPTPIPTPAPQGGRGVTNPWSTNHK